MTHTVPIVFVQVADPVGIGLVPTLMRPGGNITGFTNFEYPMIGKWLEALKEISPATSRVLMIQNPQTSPGKAGCVLRARRPHRLVWP